MGGTACACRFKLASVHTQHTLADHPRLTHNAVVRVLQQVLANVLSSAIGGMVHACVEQPVTTPIEASITQMQINGKGFFYNFRQLANLGVVNGLYRAFPAAMIGAAPKAVVHYGFLNYWINFHVSDGDIRSATKFESAMIGFSTGASEVLFTTPLNFVKFRKLSALVPGPLEQRPLLGLGRPRLRVLASVPAPPCSPPLLLAHPDFRASMRCCAGMQRPEWGYNGVVDAIQTIYRTEGILAFWKGLEAVFMRNSICMLGMVYGYKEIETRLPDNTPARHFFAGAIGGVVGSFLSYPFEMLRAAKMHNRSFMGEMVAQGPKRLFNGWLPGAGRLVVTSAIMGQIMPFIKDTSKMIEKNLGIEKK